MSKHNSSYASWTKEEDKVILAELESNKGNQTATAKKLVGVIQGRSFVSIQSRASKLQRGIAPLRKRKKRISRQRVIPTAVQPAVKNSVIKIFQKNITKSYLSAEGELILHIKF